MKIESYNTQQVSSKIKIIIEWLLIVLKPLVWIAVLIFFIVIIPIIYQSRNIPSQLSNTLTQLNSTATQLNILTTNLNKTEGTMFLLNKDVNNARLAIDNFNQAAIDERLYFETTMPIITTNINNILTNTNKLISNTNSTINETIPSQLTTITQPLNQTIKQSNIEITKLQQTTDAATQTLNQVQITASNVNKLATNPDLVASIHNINKLTKNSAQITGQVNRSLYSWRHPFKTFAKWLKHVL